MDKQILSLIQEKIKVGEILPKIESDQIWKVKTCGGTRRGEQALIYQIPNHKYPKKPHEKGINATEWDKAYRRLVEKGEFNLNWFKENMRECSKEGNCNFYTIGSIFQLLGLAKYGWRGSFLKI